ncbi:Urb2/Npa2 family-domain-containing protein [Lentinula aff. lateritia]|uniref:Urb2/Npa2 family-domain-containing protein n=1 Tax=Lentinula aff. lateritia TaxID=2804960 RepID=A0ACC1UDY7_9AGAR|nr:Urb2/Npa2 family-domain-containing protein [Lentinula aff. lateritia]
MNQVLSSSQSFVRALKASSDPPNIGGPSKIEISRAAWDQQSFHAPRKAEVIVELILNRFVKSHELQSVTDIASWQLLSDIITPPRSTTTHSWLAPLVSRVPFTRVVIQFFESVQNATFSDQCRDTRIAHDCITILWPYCISKANTDLLLECFGACLRLCTKRQPPDEYINDLVKTVAGSFHRSLSTSTAKKKTFSSFIQLYMNDWLSSLYNLSSSPDHSTLFECLYTSGIDCLFNLDVLRDSKTEDTLFIAFNDIVPEIIMPSLPRIFSSYIQAFKRNRNAIFGQGSSQKVDALEEFRETCLRFFTLSQQIFNKATDKDQSWTIKALLLDVINQEMLFTGGHLETEKLFNDMVNSIFMELAADSQDSIEPMVRCLTSLTRIDYRLVEGVLPNILSRLLMVPGTVEPALELLDIILQYHVKTRSVPLYIDTLMSISFRETVCGHDCQKVYERTCHSAGLHPSHLDRLGKCVYEFLPLNQTITAARNVTKRMENLWGEYHSWSRSLDEDSPRKRRKVDNGGSGNGAASGITLRFSTAATFASVVLSSLSADSVPKESQQELETLLNDFSSKVVLHSLSKMFKGMRKKAEESLWSDEVIILADLRLRYALDLQRSPTISVDAKCSSKLTQRMLESIDVISLPELQLELFRTFFISTSTVHQPVVLDTLLRILETVQPAAFNILHMVIQRWLPLIDLQASTAHLERFVHILVSQQTCSREGSAGILMDQALSSAQFWELSNIRSVLLTFIDKSISEISNWATATLQQQQLVRSVFNILMFVPTEYLSRTLRLSLVKRTILIEQTMDSISNAHFLHILRVCVSRIISSTDLSDNLMGGFAAYLQHLHTHEAFGQETTELVRLLLKNLFKNNNSDEIGQLIQHYSEGLQQSSFSWMNPWARTFNIFVELLLKEHPMKSFSTTAQDIFKGFYNTLHTCLFSTLVEMSKTPSAPKVTQSRGLLQCWQQTYHSCPKDVPVLDDQTVRMFTFATTPEDEETRFVVFGVLLEEFNFCAASVRLQRFETVIAAYVLLANGKYLASQGVDNFMSALCPTLSPEIFEHGLKFIVTSLEHANADECSALVNLQSILLQDSPRNTFHIVQQFMTRSISIFNDREVFTKVVHLPALRLFLRRCRDRPATLRQVDVSGVWLFIAKICAGAQSHNPTTSVETFHCIVSITTALVRLRRDLVLLTIPHLGIVLRRLIQSMQSPRPSLGPKQTALVSHSLPFWINIRYPLGVEESNALSRLLESLNTKNVVRKLTTSTTTPSKAESLAKPFSKHAGYVIKAYVESLNNPLCELSTAVRKELQPGLYALCGMMNDFSRDTLMASATDAGEKAIVKALWRQYEKQRYVGKG